MLTRRILLNETLTCLHLLRETIDLDEWTKRYEKISLRCIAKHEHRFRIIHWTYWAQLRYWGCCRTEPKTIKLQELLEILRYMWCFYFRLLNNLQRENLQKVCKRILKEELTSNSNNNKHREYLRHLVQAYNDIIDYVLTHRMA